MLKEYWKKPEGSKRARLLARCLVGVFLLNGFLLSGSAQDIPDSLEKKAAQLEQECKNNLNKIYKAIQAYKSQNGSLPSWLADLHPKYIQDKATFLCPITQTTGVLPQGDTFKRFSEREITSSYTYQFSTAKLERPGDITIREWKQRQRKVVGGKVPMVRCRMHGKVLNLAYNGEMYKSGVVWEAKFPSKKLSVRDLFSPRELDRREGRPLRERKQKKKIAQKRESIARAESTYKGIKQTLTLTYSQEVWERLASDGVHLDTDRMQHKPLLGLLTLSGDRAKKATAWGFIDLEKAVADTEETLRLQSTGHPGREARQEMVELDRPGRPAPRDPSKTIQIPLVFKAPSPKAKQLSKLKGSLRVELSKKKIAKIKDVLGQKCQVIEHPVLEKRGIKMEVHRSHTGITSRRSEAPFLQIWALRSRGELEASMELVDAKDNRIGRLDPEGGWNSPSGNFRAYRLELRHHRRRGPGQRPEGLPERVDLKMIRVVDRDLVKVPFRFKNIELPSRTDTGSAR